MRNPWLRNCVARAESLKPEGGPVEGARQQLAAIKVLPEHVASDPDLKQRFEREGTNSRAKRSILSAQRKSCRPGTGLDRVTSDGNHVEDPVRARTLAPIMVGDAVAVPIGSEVVGHVTEATPSGDVRGLARLAFRFGELRVRDEPHDIRAAPHAYQAEPTKGEDAKTIGIGAAAGALIGGLTGGRKGGRRGHRHRWRRGHCDGRDHVWGRGADRGWPHAATRVAGGSHADPAGRDLLTIGGSLWDVTPDGRRFLVAVPPAGSALKLRRVAAGLYGPERTTR